MSGPSLAFCGQDRPVKGNVQLFWDTIQEGGIEDRQEVGSAGFSPIQMPEMVAEAGPLVDFNEEIG